MDQLDQCLPKDIQPYFSSLQRKRLMESSTSHLSAQMQIAHAAISKEERHNRTYLLNEERNGALGMGFAEDAVATFELYEVEMTPEILEPVKDAIHEFLRRRSTDNMAANGGKLGTSIHVAGFLFKSYFGIKDDEPSKRPADPVFQNAFMAEIDVFLENSRIAQQRRRRSLSKEEEEREHRQNFVQNFHVHGGTVNNSQTGSIHAQNLTGTDLTGLMTALSTIQASLRGQWYVAGVDQDMGLLLRAREAAQNRDESKVVHYLSQVSKKGLDIITSMVPQVASQVVTAFLKQHGLL